MRKIFFQFSSHQGGGTPTMDITPLFEANPLLGFWSSFGNFRGSVQEGESWEEPMQITTGSEGKLAN